MARCTEGMGCDSGAIFVNEIRSPAILEEYMVDMKVTLEVSQVIASSGDPEQRLYCYKHFGNLYQQTLTYVCSSGTFRENWAVSVSTKTIEHQQVNRCRRPCQNGKTPGYVSRTGGGCAKVKIEEAEGTGDGQC